MPHPAANQKVFQDMKDGIRSGDMPDYLHHVAQITRFISEARAFYPEAKPEILEILELAAFRLHKWMSVPASAPPDLNQAITLFRQFLEMFTQFKSMYDDRPDLHAKMKELAGWWVRNSVAPTAPRISPHQTLATAPYPGGGGVKRMASTSSFTAVNPSQAPIASPGIPSNTAPFNHGFVAPSFPSSPQQQLVLAQARANLQAITTRPHIPPTTMPQHVSVQRTPTEHSHARPRDLPMIHVTPNALSRSTSITQSPISASTATPTKNLSWADWAALEDDDSPAAPVANIPAAVTTTTATTPISALSQNTISSSSSFPALSLGRLSLVTLAKPSSPFVAESPLEEKKSLHQFVAIESDPPPLPHAKDADTLARYLPATFGRPFPPVRDPPSSVSFIPQQVTHVATEVVTDNAEAAAETTKKQVVKEPLESQPKLDNARSEDGPAEAPEAQKEDEPVASSLAPVVMEIVSEQVEQAPTTMEPPERAVVNEQIERPSVDENPAQVQQGEEQRKEMQELQPEPPVSIVANNELPEGEVDVPMEEPNATQMESAVDASAEAGPVPAAAETSWNLSGSDPQAAHLPPSEQSELPEAKEPQSEVLPAPEVPDEATDVTIQSQDQIQSHTPPPSPPRAEPIESEAPPQPRSPTEAPQSTVQSPQQSFQTSFPLEDNNALGLGFHPVEGSDAPASDIVIEPKQVSLAPTCPTPPVEQQETQPQPKISPDGDVLMSDPGPPESIPDVNMESASVASDSPSQKTEVASSETRSAGKPADESTPPDSLPNVNENASGSPDLVTLREIFGPLIVRNAMAMNPEGDPEAIMSRVRDQDLLDLAAYRHRVIPEARAAGLIDVDADGNFFVVGFPKPPLLEDSANRQRLLAESPQDRPPSAMISEREVEDDLIKDEASSPFENGVDSSRNHSSPMNIDAFDVVAQATTSLSVAIEHESPMHIPVSIFAPSDRTTPRPTPPPATEKVHENTKALRANISSGVLGVKRNFDQIDSADFPPAYNQARFATPKLKRVARPIATLELGKLETEPQDILAAKSRTLGTINGEAGRASTEVSFGISEEEMIQVSRWNNRFNSFDATLPHSCIRLHCYDRALYEATLPLSTGPPLKDKWPTSGGHIFVAYKPSAEVTDDALLYVPVAPPILNSTTAPICLSPLARPGQNSLRIVQLSGCSDLVFVLQLGPPSEEDMGKMHKLSFANQTLTDRWNSIRSRSFTVPKLMPLPKQVT